MVKSHKIWKITRNCGSTSIYTLNLNFRRYYISREIIMIDKGILEQIESYYSASIPNFSQEFDIIKLDTNSFVFECKDTGIIVALNWNDMFESIRHPQILRWAKDEDTKYKTLLSYRLKQGIKEGSSKIDVLDHCGFFTRGYGEYLLTYTTWDMNYPKFDSFKIDNVNVTIGRPSNLYRFIFNYFWNDDGLVDGWNSFYTVKVENCTREELEGILQQALLCIATYVPPEIKGDYPEIIPFQFEDDHWVWNDEPELPEKYDFPKTNHHEPLAFYNRARKSDDLLYYYKVLEYFFIINKKSEIQMLVSDYNIDSKIDKLMNSITKIYATKEDRLLENLLSNINGIDEIIERAYKEEIIQVKDLTTFSNKLYEYRNSIVHGKKDARFELTVPTILNQDTNDNRWKGIIRILAEKVISQFCLNS